MPMQKIGILSIQGDIEEHREALINASNATGERMACLLVKSAKECEGLDGLVIPGGESTTMAFHMGEELRSAIKKMPKLLGTCAGLIIIAKRIADCPTWQVPLGLLDVEVRRNTYGSQIDSFEAELETKFGKMKGIFIRAPTIEKIGVGVEVLASFRGKPVAVYQPDAGNGKPKIIGAAFHPELSTTKFHEFFLKI